MNKKDVTLKPLTEQHLEKVRNWRNSEEVSQYMYTERFISPKDQKEWFNKISNRNDCIYWIIEYAGKDVGVANLNKIDYLNKNCHWAFYLGDFSVKGTGVGAKTEYQVIEYVFKVLKLNKLIGEVIVSNEKVIRMHEKFGFRREGYHREHFIKGDKPIDIVSIGLLKSEWDQLENQIRLRVYGR